MVVFYLSICESEEGRFLQVAAQSPAELAYARPGEERGDRDGKDVGAEQVEDDGDDERHPSDDEGEGWMCRVRRVRRVVGARHTQRGNNNNSNNNNNNNNNNNDGNNEAE
jgi:hypothetical protein